MKLDEKLLSPNMNSFAKNALDGKYVLILGSSALLKIKDENDEYDGDSMKLLLKKTLEAHYSQHEPDILSYKIEKTKSFTEWTELTGLYRKDALSIACREINELSLDDIVDPSLKQLLETELFRVIITTSVDPVIENLMNEIWGGKGGYDVIIGPDDSKIKGGDSIQSSILVNRERPVLCYLLGSADSNKENRKECALTEAEVLNWMAKWIVNSNDDNSFMKSIQKDWLHVSVGCKFDDWMFRFFWYLVTGEAGKGKDYGEVAVDIEVGNVEDIYNAPLSTYLYGEKLRVSFKTSRSFMEEAISVIGEGMQNWEMVNQDKIREGTLFDNDNKSVFLSYAHEDYPYVRILYKKLESNGFSVWMDESDKRGLRGGANIDNTIRKTIEHHCRFFVPILTSTTWNIIKGKKDKNPEANKRYVLKEWDWAKGALSQKASEPELGTMAIIPLTTKTYWNENNRKENINYNIYEYYERKYLPKNENGSNGVKHMDNMSELVDELITLTKNS